ncbi:D-alanyl-D-alanine carboxypeptidase [Sphingomonas populi]|uniref:D-alanyl-D-alanine carboxypeptidase n=1 Tax=Sphingomonas populi TaxID=2484750 RepID=A0A4Q6Y9B8_9SPHN|nr:D-alanyl-D-alanine carboxypeptidase family protein [Sphingomonas populi]RZF66387.1 D-alanyl-D-alanine carboxypeptidase [Sphingomonas populi]
MYRLNPTSPRRLLLGACALLYAVGPQPLFARKVARPTSELLVDASSGRAIYASLPDEPRRPASLTKMMTLYLVFDALDAGRLRLNDPVPISRNAARQPASRLGIAAGKSLPVRAVIKAMAVDSANDVTVAIAERLCGSENAFAAAMNAKARQLGMTNTRFANATGLTNRGNQTTARDMAGLSLALLKRHARYYPVFATPSIIWRSRRIVNHDHLLGKVSGVDGIKTGYTADAGYNIATSAQRRGKRIIAVVLGADSLRARDRRAAELVEFGFTHLPAARR